MKPVIVLKQIKPASMQQFNSERSYSSKFLSATRIVCLSLLILFLSVQAGAQNFIVNNNGDTHAVNAAASPLDAGGNITLRSAVEAANAQAGAHIITFSGAVTTINLSLGQISVGSATSLNIAINGPGMNILTVNQTTAARIFSTTTSNNFNFTMQDMTLNYAGPANTAGTFPGSFSGGGGALLAGGTGAVTTVTNCKVTNWRNQSGNGGAIAVTFSTVSHNFTMSGCVFDNNMCGGGGGAVAYSGLGTVNISNCTFTNNSCGPVGMNIGGSGGALNLTGQAPGGTYSVTECTFVNNSCANATSPGGAVMHVNGQLALNYNRFVGNVAAAGGSAVYQSGGDAAYVINATNNWWGHNTAPTAAEVSNGPAPVTPPNVTKWLQLKLSASPATLCATTAPTSALVTASFLSNSSNEVISASNLGAIIGLPITYSATLGTLSGAQNTIQATGTSTVTFTTNGTAGTATVNGVVDNVPANDPTARASITVNILPNISSQPTNQTTCAGSTTTFSVTGGGTPTPAYQWRKGVTNLSNGATGNGSTISGATTNTLTITNTALADAASDYNVVLTNSCGTATSNNVSLTVKALPVITAPTVTQPTCTTPTGTIVVNATGASGTIEYSINNGGSYQASNTFVGIAPSTNANIVVRYTASPNCPVSYASNPVVINAVPLPPTVNNPATTTGTVGTAFSQTFTTTGGLAPITFATTSILPTGLTLSVAGVLSGTPTQSGTFPIVVKATDANGCVGTGATYNLVISCQTITVTNPGVATGTNGTPFSQTFTQTGALGGATFTINTGTLPNGLTLSAAGVLSGTPSAPAATYPITVKVTDGNGCTGISATYNLVISCQTITVTNPVVTTGQLNIPFSQTFTQTGGIGATTFSTVSALPGGITLSSAGVLSGTPTSTGTFPIVVKATDANGCFGNGATYTLVITACPVNDQTVTASPTSVCSGTGSTITVGASQPGVNYTLRIDPANTVVGGPTAGSGGPISFPTGNLTVATTYNVLAETDAYSIYLNGGVSGPAIPQASPLDVTDNFTIEGWIKPDGNPDFARLFNKDGCYALGISANQTQLTFTRHGAGDFSRPFTFVDGTWYHIASTYSGGTVELFVNGTSIGTVAGVPMIITNTVGGHIGSDASGNFNRFKGNIDNVRIWSSVRTQAQIAANQSAYLTSTGNPSLVASWWIIEGSGNVKDYSANAINSTNLGGAVWMNDVPVAPCSIVLSTKPTVSITPDNTITLTSAAGTNAQTKCIGAPITTITYSTTGATGATFTGLPAGVTGNWAANVVTISGIPPATAATYNYTIDLTGGCGTVSTTGSITVNPTPTVNAVGNQTVCNGAPTTAVTFSGAVAGTVYNWTNNTPSIGLAASGSGNIASFTATNATAAAVTATITVTPAYTSGGTTCTGTPTTFTITVNPTPTVNAVANQAVCNGAPTAAVSFSGAVTGTVYNWTNNTLSIGLGASGTGNIASFTATNATAAAVTATITVTPSYTNAGTTCTGTPTTFTITVNPTPTVNAVANQAVCNGAPTTIINFSGAVTGTVYNWTNNTPSIGLAASGSGDIGAFIGTNGTNAPVTATITVTPSYTNAGTTCTGTPTTFTITVNPSNTVAQIASQTVCNGANTTAITFSSTATGGTVVYNWTGTDGTIGLPISGSGNIASFAAINTGTTVVTDTIKVTAAYTNGGTTCNSAVMLFVITVNPTATVNTVANQTVCNGAPTAAVTFSGTVPGTVYQWTNNTTSIGLAASGTGNIASFTATNATAAPVTATVTVTPVFYNQSIQGSLVSGDLTMPSRLFRDGIPSTCANKAFPGTSAGAHLYDTYSFVNTTGQSQCVSVSYAAKSSGDVFVAAYNNSFNPAALSTNYIGDGGLSSIGGSVSAFSVTVAPGATLVLVALEANSAPCPNYVMSVSGIGMSCTGTPKTFTITVNPTPTVNAVANQTVCNGAPTAAVNFSGATTGTVYNWTNNTPSIGLAASGTGNIASFNGINATAAPITATITVTPSYTNNGTTCTGTPTTFTITVNPTPTVNAVANQTVCNGAPTAAVTFSGAVAGTVYNWINNTTSIGLAGSGTGNIASFNGINATASPVTATITVTPSYTNNGTTCTGTPTTFTITVNPTPTVNTVANQELCNGATTTAVTFSGAVTGTVYNWTNNTPSIGLAASGSGNIAAFTAVNLTNAPVIATITVTPSYTNAGTTCTGSPKTFTITVDPKAHVNAVSSQVVCNGAPTTAVTFSGNTANTVYNWVNNTPSIGLAASGSGNIASFTATNATGAPVVATITVTPSFTGGTGSCPGDPITFTITVNPTPTVNAVANQTVCNSANTAAVTFTGNAAGTVYSWTNNTPSIGLAASGTGNIASFVATNAGVTPVTATITVTPSYTNAGTTCTGTPTTFTITVNPTPTVNTVANQVVCNNANTTAVTFSGAVTGTVYNWTNNTTSIGLAASGTGNIASFVATNATNAAVVATITVTPSYTNNGTTCTGTPKTFTITVNPTPTVNTIANQTVCNNANTAAVTFTGFVPGTVYSWTNNTTSIGLAASGTGNIASFVATNAGVTPVTATITVTPSYTNAGTTCTGTPTTFTITVNPTPTVNTVANQVVCNNANTTAVTFSGAVTGTVYNWTNNTTSIGLAASGTGNIASFVATNATNAPVTATITVTPSYTNNGTTCTGTPKTFTITVNPTPTVNTVANQTVCNNANTAAVTFTGFVPGTVYSWTNNTTSIGLAASGTGNIASFVATNPTNAPVTATITVTPSYTNGGTTCTGTPTTFTITVNPTPTVNAVVNQTVCNGGPTTNVNFTGFVPGTVYNWTNNTTSIGLAASGTGDILSFTGTNATNAPVTATITVTPSYTNGGTTCTGTPITFTITVNPTPVINAVANQTVCNNANTAAVNFSSPTTGGTIVYDWSNNVPSIGLASSGSGNIPSFVAINNGTTPVTATITVIPSYTNNGVTCTGPSISFTITVNPTPSVNPVADQAVCNGSGSTPVTFTSPIPGTVFNWTNSNAAIGLGASGTGNIASFTGTNAGTTAISGTITVTPTFTNGSTTCTGAPITFVITINPTPTVNTVANQTVCNNSSTAAVTFSGAVTGTVYNWTNSTTSIGLAASGTGNIASFTATNATNAPVTATITVTPSYTNAGTTCSGTPKTFTITVNPTPTVNAVANQVVCNGATTSATFTGAVTGTVFNWTNNTTSIGLAASGTGNIPNFTATNTGTTPVTATITVTPSYTNGSTTCTGTPITFTITVNPSTVIGTQPANVTLCAGGNASFTVAATGVGLSYQWQVNTGSGFNNIPGATAATLNVNAVTAAMNGYQYHVIVTGTCGAVTSANATLTVNTAPAIATQPVNVAACIGNNATFTVVATGTALTYQWQVNTGSGFNNIPGATSASLTVNSVTAAMNGYQYHVIVSGTCTPSQTSNNVTLSINQAAVITGQPASVLICFGGSASFSVTATGTGLTYQWQVNTGSGFTNIAGATSSTLVIPAPPILFSFNQYRVIVSSPCNSVTSNVATLIIFALPNISFSSVPPRVCLTDTIVTLRAQPAGGTWSGRGVSGDKFSAVAAGTGVSTLTYTVTNSNGCISVDYFNVTVNDCKERHNTFRDAIKIYPNPSNGQFYVKFLSDIYTDVNLRLIDGSGREVKAYHFSGLTYGSILPIDARSLASGVYTLQAYNAADRASFRIVIAH
jgi:hypothetical protein